MNHTDPPATRSSRLLVIAAVAGVTALFTGFVLMSGCTKPTTTTKEKEKQEVAAGNPWEEFGQRLRKANDLAACKTAVAQLKTALAGRKEFQPPPPGPQDEQVLNSAPLSPDDLSQARDGSFTTLDAIYLADCFYLRDAARTLDTPGLSQARRAELAFAWVCRQVYLNPWVIDIGPRAGQLVPAVPPTFVLRRGYGSGLERAYVLLALLQQMRLDGCLVGPPDAGSKPAAAPPNGPFWAVGVRVENDVLLFDPWRGEAFPGPGGKGTGTLAQVKANPDQLKAWFEAKNPVWGVSPDDVRRAAVFVAVPVNALSPRMAFLEDKLKTDGGLKGEAELNVAESPVALRDRVQKAVPQGTTVALWGPPEDRFAYVRVLPTFLPVEEGGRDSDPPIQRAYDLYRQALLPLAVLSLPPAVPPAARDRLRAAAANNYATAFLAPPTPRERIQRGQTQEANRFLTDKQEGFGRGWERLRNADPQEVDRWCQKAAGLYADLDRARRPVAGGPQQPDSDPGVQEALGAIEQFWKTDAPAAQVIIDRSTARAGMTESSYLLALSKHEEAERVQLRAETAPGPDAERLRAEARAKWKEADGTWQSYVRDAAGYDPFPNRPAHARTLAARAELLAK
jgi:hypothetical protein